MALIVCPECKAKISEYAESCPHCGCPMKVIVKLIVEQEKSAITTEQSDFTEVATAEKNPCLQCGKEVAQAPGRKKKKFCSDACRSKWWAAHPEQIRHKSNRTINCAFCGKAFQVHGGQKRKYCSHDCYIMDRFSEKEADVSAEKAYADSGTFENMKDQKSPSADRNVKKKHTKKDAVVSSSSAVLSPEDSNTDVVENLAASPALTSSTSKTTDSSGYFTEEEFKVILNYGMTIHLMKNMLVEGIIDTDEYLQMEKLFQEKYKSPYAHLMFEKRREELDKMAGHPIKVEVKTLAQRTGIPFGRDDCWRFGFGDGGEKYEDEYAESDVLFQFQVRQLIGDFGKDGGRGVTVLRSGEVLEEHLLVVFLYPDRVKRFYISQEAVAEIESYLQEKKLTILRLPENVINGNCEGEHDWVRFGSKRINGFQITRSDPRQVRMKDADYYTKYAENMETENVIIDMYEDIREILVRAGIDILPKK